MSGRPAVFLDRDGVLNQSLIGADGVPRPPAGLAQFALVDGAAEACCRLGALGLLRIVVTNQPDVARGTQRREVVEAIHQRLRESVSVDDIRICYHDDDDLCDCRKPKPGLLLSAANDWGIDLAASFMIGDRWRDIEAGQRAGCTTILIDTRTTQPLAIEPTVRVESLSSAVSWISERVARATGAAR
ncbi:MAG: HAD family hydrolase [Candidatus Limnocylindrales bacterium]